MNTITLRPPAQCSSCGEPIYWLQHAQTHRVAPIEVKQSDTGNVLVNLERGTYQILPADERAEHAGWLHLNHFSTCPQAKVWKQAGRGGGRSGA